MRDGKQRTETVFSFTLLGVFGTILLFLYFFIFQNETVCSTRHVLRNTYTTQQNKHYTIILERFALTPLLPLINYEVRVVFRLLKKQNVFL